MKRATGAVRSILLVSIFTALSLHAGPANKIPVTTSSAEARKEFLLGRELFENLKRQEAAPYFKKAFTLDPGFALAAAYYAQSEGTARGFFDNLAQAAALAPKVSEGERELILGWQAGGSGKLAEQRTHWENAVRLYPKDERALTLLGHPLLRSAGLPEFRRVFLASGHSEPGIPSGLQSARILAPVPGRLCRRRECVQEIHGAHP